MMTGPIPGSFSQTTVARKQPVHPSINIAPELPGPLLLTWLQVNEVINDKLQPTSVLDVIPQPCLNCKVALTKLNLTPVKFMHLCDKTWLKQNVKSIILHSKVGPSTYSGHTSQYFFIPSRLSFLYHCGVFFVCVF